MVAFAAALLALASCGGLPSPAAPLRPPTQNLARAFAAALDAEARDSTAAEGYLDVIDEAVSEPAGGLATVAASVDALVFGAIPALDELGPTGIAYRARERMPVIAERLAAAWDAAEDVPFARGLLAMALHNLSLYVGDEAAAQRWTERRGCAREATVVGPLDWAPLSGLDAPSPIAHDAPLAQSYPGVAPFAAKVVPLRVRADACYLDVNAPTFLAGVRAVIVDVHVPRSQRVQLALTTTSAAVLDVGGVSVLKRGYAAGGRPVTRFVSVVAPAGRMRVVARVGQKGDGNLVEIDAWDEEGLPLQTRAPRPGDSAGGGVRGARVVDLGAQPGASPEQVALSAAALMGLGEGRAAEHLLEQARDPAGRGATKRTPRSELVYVRATELAEDSPPSKAAERMRSALEGVLSATPDSWEARIAHARLSERRRGAGEGVVEALRELGADPRPSASPKRKDRMVLAQTAVVGRRAGMIDVAESAYRELEKAAGGSALLANVDARLHPRVGAEAVRAACNGGTSRAETACLEALAQRGDLPAQLAEITRLRRLRVAPDALRDVEVSQRVARGDVAGALETYDAMPLGQRTLMLAPALAAGRGQVDAARRRLARDRISARDAPWGIAALSRALGTEADLAPALEAEGARIVAEDRAKAFLPGAGTAVLRHVERYSIEASGLVRFSSYDLRRVSGTTDVERGAPSFGPMIEGRTAPRLLRRRIHKRDGRVLEPDAAANAAQGNSDLSQLEQGDYVEQILEGWALPGDTGQLVLDTPDLLPERTSVRDAEIELRYDAAIPLAVWSHRLLGRAERRRDGRWQVSTWRVRDQTPRRIEDGVPKMERTVSVSMGTQTWANVARALSDNARALDDNDPYVRRWAEEVAGADRRPSRALVDRLVVAAGKKIKAASGAELSDVAAMFSGGPQRTTARTTLEMGTGSRSWVIYRALRELGVPVDLAVAETEPFSASADFPPHVGRFRHPLVVARLPGEREIWIDSDVEGPPLPPGKVSPELRGRTAMLLGGKMVVVEGSSDAGDEVDVRLVLDAKGDAAGTFAAVLHGRAAQALSEAFETVVGTERQQLLRAVVLGWLPWADVEEVTVSPAQGGFGLALQASIRIHGYGRPEGRSGQVWALPGLEPVHLVFPRAAVGTLAAHYASRAARQSALSIEVPLLYRVRRRIELPAGATVTKSPEPVRVQDARIDATRKVSVEGQVIDETFTLSLPTGTVAADSYQQFVEKVHAVDGGFMAVTRVKVKP
jgi:hypothetical protein